MPMVNWKVPLVGLIKYECKSPSARIVAHLVPMVSFWLATLSYDTL